MSVLLIAKNAYHYYGLSIVNGGTDVDGTMSGYVTEVVLLL